MKASLRSILIEFATNTGWMFLERVISIVVTIAVGLYFVRYLGPDRYGMFSYALGLYVIFLATSRLGINPLITRATVLNPEHHGRILGSALVMRLGAALGCLLLLNLAAFVLMDDALTRRMSLIMSVGLLFAPFETVTHWFEATSRMKPIALARSAVVITIGLVKLTLVLAGAGVLWFAWLAPLELALIALLFGAVYRQSGFSLRQWKPDIAIMKEFALRGAPLFLSNVAVLTYMKIDQIMLGKMTSPREVGIYAAAVGISEMFYFVPVILSSLAFPYLIRSRSRGEPFFAQAFQLLCDGFAWMAIGLAVLMTLFSSQLIALAYGEQYAQSAIILSVHIWAGLFVFAETLRSKWFVVREVLHFQLITTVTGAFLNIALNLILIPRYQGLGAAVATAASYGVAVILMCFMAAETRPVGRILAKSMLAPFRVSASLASLFLLRKSLEPVDLQKS